VRALARWAFDELALNRLWLRVYEDNPRGQRSYEKVGFKVEGRLRQDRFHGGRYMDTVVMGLLRDELVR
jgi:diamine N-acetyltransferase